MDEEVTVNLEGKTYEGLLIYRTGGSGEEPTLGIREIKRSFHRIKIRNE